MNLNAKDKSPITSLSSNTDIINNNQKTIFLAITGNFTFHGEDRTSFVSPNGSPTEKIFLAVESIAKSIDQKLESQFIAPGTTCETSVKTASDFINKNYQRDDSIIVYGYSNGGRCAMDLVTELQKQKKPVDLLITVDATDAKSKFFGNHNTTVDSTTPTNVKLHKNFYQNDECGILKCPSGATMQAESPVTTTVINYKTQLDSLTNEEHKTHLHRHMETINKDEILKTISSTLQTTKTNE